MTSDHYYAPTAYDSTRPRALPPRLPKEQWSRVSRYARGDGPSLPWGIYVGDYRNSNSKGSVRRLKRKDEKVLAQEGSAEVMRVPTMDNPKAKWIVLRNVAAMLLIVALLTMAAAWHNAGAIYFEKNPVLLLTVIIPFALTFLGALGALLAKDANNIIFNRRTGIVTLPISKLKRSFDLRFDELDGYLRFSTDPQSGSIHWQLHLGGRDRNGGIEMANAEASHKAYMYQLWESLQQFMDISKPLPDLAVMEPVRHLDPTTAAYDQAHHRPPHYWRERDPEAVKIEAKEVDNCIRDFRWEYLPHGNDPYDQYASIAAWRERYPNDADNADWFKRKGWWQTVNEPVAAVR